MGIALIGKYYKTFEAAKEAFLKLEAWEQDNKSIVEFDNAYLIVGNQTIEKINGRKN